MMRCKFEHDGDCCNSGAAQYMCKCKQPCSEIIPMTNGDVIRCMNDKELADELAKVASWDRKEFERAKHIGLKKFMFDWLNKPAEA